MGRFAARVCATLLALATPTAFASPIPITSEGLVISSADFVFTTEPGDDQQSDNSPALSGSGVGDAITSFTIVLPGTATMPNSFDEQAPTSDDAPTLNTASVNELVAVPEPASFALFGAALIGFAVLTRGRGKRV